jgi:glycerol-3-phosphate dehydrogenase (NAD(P)+)
VELGGALKNIYAIAAGISDGLGLGDNAKSALVTRSLAEMIRLGTALGGQQETFYGLSGLGDLIVTCFSIHSRNRGLGERLGRGESLADIQKSMVMIAEGVPTARSAYEEARKLGLDTPLLDTVHAVLFEGLSPRDGLMQLLARDPKRESEPAT